MVSMNCELYVANVQEAHWRALVSKVRPSFCGCDSSCTADEVRLFGSGDDGCQLVSSPQHRQGGAQCALYGARQLTARSVVGRAGRHWRGRM